MPRVTKTKPKAPKNSAITDAARHLQVVDAFQNLLARTGFGTPSLMEGTQYPLTRLTQNYNLLNSLYRNSWLARRIIDLIPKDMLKNGWKYESDISPDDITRLEKVTRTTKLKRDLLHGLNWGRLYGGAAGLMMLDGQEDILEEPLDLDSIMPGDFKGLLVVDRWSGCYPTIELVDDISDPEFGLPKYYEFREWATSIVARVHHSRIIRFTGDDLPEWEKMAEIHWGSSIIESVFEELKKRDNTSANIAGLIFLANLRILKMSHLGQTMTSTAKGAQAQMQRTLQSINWLQSNFGLMLLNEKDDFQQFTLQNFTGINAVYESFMLDVSGAAQIPVTKLFGRAPAGMNATGESDLRNYYDVVEGEQETHLKPALEKLLPVICMAELGQIPDEIEIEFNPVETPSDENLGKSIQWRSTAIFEAHDRSLISDRMAMMELKQMADGTGLFTNITDKDIAEADDELGEPDLLPGAIPGPGGDLPGGRRNA